MTSALPPYLAPAADALTLTLLAYTRKSPRFLWLQPPAEGAIGLGQLFEIALRERRTWPNPLELDLVNAACSRELQKRVDLGSRAFGSSTHDFLRSYPHSSRFDVHAFDMACILRTKRDAAEPYVPGAACWLQTAAAPTPRVALAAADEAAPIRVYAAPTFALVAKLRVHASPVVALCPLPPLGLVVSADARGVLECWRCADGPRRGDDGKGAAVSEVPAEAPGDAVAYRSKLDTDLYALAKARAGPCRISASSDLSLIHI